MNKSQRMVAGIGLILMGIVSFILAASIVNASIGIYVFRRYMLEIYPIIHLGMAFTQAGIFVLISKKRE